MPQDMEDNIGTECGALVNGPFLVLDSTDTKAIVERLAYREPEEVILTVSQPPKTPVAVSHNSRFQRSDEGVGRTSSGCWSRRGLKNEHGNRSHEPTHRTKRQHGLLTTAKNLGNQAMAVGSASDNGFRITPSRVI